MRVLAKPTQFLIFLFLLFGGLYFARTVLIPVTIGGLLAMLFFPVSKKLEQRGINRGLASTLCIVCLLGVGMGLLILLKWQSTDLLNDLTGIEDRIKQVMAQVQAYIDDKFGINPQQQKKLVKEQQSSGVGQLSTMMTKSLSSLLGIGVDSLLVFVYAYLILYFRNHLKKFVLKLVDSDSQSETREALYESSKVAQQYLTGLAIMVLMLWILYGIGFSIVGVKQAIFLAILCGILETVPFVGNLTGSLLTILLTIAQGGSSNMVLGIIVVYGVVQFTQSYLIEPLIVGAEVNINPLFTILAIVIGEAVWGIPGMIVALPVLGIIKIICDHVDSLKPYGFLIGKIDEDESSLLDRLKGVFSKK